MVYANRTQAGRELADTVARLAPNASLVLALPRGGVVVAYEVAHRLHAPLDVILVRKIGAPYQPELAVGAVVDGEEPIRVLNEEIARLAGATPAYLERAVADELAVIERRRGLYREGRPPTDPKGHAVIVVDDGVATGSTMRAALRAVRRAGARRIILAVPVGASDAMAELRNEADDTICLEEPYPFMAIGAHYHDFSQIDDGEVVRLLRAAARESSTGKTAT